MQPVERSEPEGVDYGWVMQMTFVFTIVVGAPLVALLSTRVELLTWGERATFAIQVGAPVWFLTAILVFAYAKRTTAGDSNAGGDSITNEDGTGAGDDGTTNGESFSERHS